MSLLRTTRALAAFGLCALAAPTALAVDCTPVQLIDQTNAIGAPQRHGNSPSALEVAQTFTAPCDGVMDAFYFYFTAVPGTVNEFLEIEATLLAGTDPNTWTALHTDLRQYRINGNGVENMFFLMGETPVVQGQQYTVLLNTTANPPAGYTNPDVFIRWANTAGAYPGGEMLYNTSFGVIPSGGDLRFTAQFDPPLAVPVELSSFEGVADGRDALLTWATSSETNNAGFDVELASGDGWQTLGFVDGHGTTAEPRSYAHRVPGLSAGLHRFRLRQVDYDGTATHTPEVEVAIGVGGTFGVSALAPNPAAERAVFRVASATAQHVAVTLHDVLGRTVARPFDGSVDGGVARTVALDLSALPAGAYVVRIQGETFAETQRMTVLR